MIAKIRKYLLILFVVLPLAKAYSDDFELGIRAYNDSIYGISLKYLSKFLEEAGESDIERKIIAQFTMSRIYVQTGRIREACPLVDTILKRKSILQQNGIYDSALLMKVQCTAFLSGIREAFELLEHQGSEKSKNDLWRHKISIVRFLAEVKDDAVIDEVITLYRDEMDSKAESLLYLMKVEYLLRKDRAHEALSLLTEKIEKEMDAVKSDPSLFSFYSSLKGDAFYKTLDYASAIAFYQKSLEAGDPYYLDKALLDYKLGLAYWKKGDASSSLKILKEFLEKNDNRKEVNSAASVLSQIYIELKEYDMARETLLQYLDPDIKDRDYFKALYWMGEACYRQGQYGDAMKAYNDMLASGDGEVVALASYGKAWVHYKSGEYDLAKTAFDDLAKQSLAADMLLSVKLAQANLSYLTGNYEECRDTLQKLIEEGRNVDRDKIFYKIGMCYLSLGDYAEAIASFQKAAEKEGSQIQEKSLYKIAQAYFLQGEYEEAIMNYKVLNERFPQGPLYYKSYLEIGHAYYNLFRYGEAIDTYRFIIENAKKDYYRTKATYFLGWCYYLLGKESDTVKIFRSYLKDFPNSNLSPDIQFWLGEYFFNKKQYTESLKEYRQLVERYPDCSLVDDALFWGAKASQKLGDAATSLSLLDSLVTKYAKSDLIPDAYLDKSDIYSGRKEYDKALLALEEVIQKYPESYLYYDSLIKKARLLKITGKINEAELLYEDVLQRLQKEKKTVSPDWIWEAAVVNKEANKNDEAVEKLLLLIYGNNSPEMFKKSILLAKDILVQEGRLEDAEILLNKLLNEGKNINRISIRREIRKLQLKINERNNQS